MVITTQTIDYLNKLLNLPAKGGEQDWAIELADRFRITEFLKIIQSEKLLPTDKYAIMSLVLASYEDLLQNGSDHNFQLWEKIVDTLSDNPNLYKDLLNYWAIWDESDTNNQFMITNLVREYQKQIKLDT
jgi:hypothetical protein